MCAVSMVSDHYRTIPEEKWDLTRWTDYKELKRKAEEYDRIMRQSDCPDAEKIKFEKTIEEYLKKKGIIG